MKSGDLKRWRKALGLSQKEAAEALGLKRRVMQYYEKGERDGKKVKVPLTVRLACFALDQGVTDYEGPVKGAKDPAKAPPKPAGKEKLKPAAKKKPGRPKGKAAPPAPKPPAPPDANSAAGPTPDPVPAASVPAPAPMAAEKPKANPAAKPRTTRAKPGGAKAGATKPAATKPAGTKAAAARSTAGRARTSTARANKPATTRRGRPPKKP